MTQRPYCGDCKQSIVVDSRGWTCACGTTEPYGDDSDPGTDIPEPAGLEGWKRTMRHEREQALRERDEARCESETRGAYVDRLLGKIAQRDRRIAELEAALREIDIATRGTIRGVVVTLGDMARFALSAAPAQPATAECGNRGANGLVCNSPIGHAGPHERFCAPSTEDDGLFSDGTCSQCQYGGKACPAHHGTRAAPPSPAAREATAAKARHSADDDCGCFACPRAACFDGPIAATPSPAAAKGGDE